MDCVIFLFVISNECLNLFVYSSINLKERSPECIILHIKKELLGHLMSLAAHSYLRQREHGCNNFGYSR